MKRVKDVQVGDRIYVDFIDRDSCFESIKKIDVHENGTRKISIGSDNEFLFLSDNELVTMYPEDRVVPGHRHFGKWTQSTSYQVIVFETEKPYQELLEIPEARIEAKFRLYEDAISFAEKKAVGNWHVIVRFVPPQ